MTPELIETLTARIAALEERVVELSAMVAAPRGSMRLDQRCPACGHGELFLAAAESVAAGHLSPLAVELDASAWTNRVMATGKLAYLVCRACRLVELQAIDLDGIKASDRIKEVTAPATAGPAPTGPYR